MKIVCVAAASLALMTGTMAFAADTTETPIRAMLDAFNRGDVKAAKAAHVAAPTIVDEPVGPYIWSGPNAFDSWVAALAKSEADKGETGGKVALGPTMRTSITGNTAYAVVPSTYTFQRSGRTMRETGTMTFALVKQGESWKIRAWTWTSPEAVPVSE